MTKERINRLIKIQKCISDAIDIINRASLDVDKDYGFIFGTSAKPTWAPEDHVHLSSGEIVDIKLKEDRILFRTDKWVNAFGEKIWGAIRVRHIDDSDAIVVTKKGLFKDYYPTITYPNSQFYEFRKDYLKAVERQVLDYLIDHFDVVGIKSKTRALSHMKGGYEFGLSLDNKDNYYKKTVKNQKN